MQTNFLFGKTLILTPLSNPDMTNALAPDNAIRFEPALLEFDNKKLNTDQIEGQVNIFADCDKVNRAKCKRVGIEASFPRNNAVITYTIERDLVPIVRGCSGERGYLWLCPLQVFNIDGIMINVQGLRSLLRQAFPELLPRFNDGSVLRCIDGKILAADIPLTTALIRDQQQQDLYDAITGATSDLR